MSTIKFRRVVKLAKIGGLHFTVRTILDKIPDDMLDRLPARDIANIIDLMYESKCYGEWQGWADAAS